LLIALDHNGCFERVYPGFTKALGYEERDVLGRPIIDLITEDSLAYFIKSFGWYDPPRPVFRMLHRDNGIVAVRMEWYEFVQGKGRIILRLA
jgi:PAS domain-containing protein